jgi:3-methyladenine DNA glycosylase AlkD
LKILSIQYLINMSELSQLKKDLRSSANPKGGEGAARFFKTGKGEYGEGDIFIGVTVPQARNISKRYATLDIADIEKLLTSKIHEERSIALYILVNQFKTAKENDKKKIYNFYLAHTKYINNWDLVDASAHYIVGAYLIDKDRKILEKLAKSKNLWEKRIAIVATFAFIYNGEYEWTFRIAKIVMGDQHDLIHKASGWMLREVGKRASEEKLCEFLDVYAPHMPRTTLRYAIERFAEPKRKAYLAR